MIRRPPRSTLFPTRRSSDLGGAVVRLAADPDRALDFLGGVAVHQHEMPELEDRKSTRLNSSHTVISYAVFCLKKKKKMTDSYVVEYATQASSSNTLSSR